MEFTLSNQTGNIIRLTNDDDDNILYYTIHVLGDNGIFSPASGFVEVPTAFLPAGTSLDINLSNDGIYKLLTSDIVFETQGTYYFKLDYNLRMCELRFDKEILCNTCECVDAEQIRLIKRQNKFIILKERFYYQVNKYIQDQSVYDMIFPTNAEILYWSDILEQLTKLCDICNDKLSSSGSLDKDCGCS